MSTIPELPKTPKTQGMHPVAELRSDPAKLALYLAWHARAALEPMHLDGTLTPEMRRLNNALRDGIYTALVMLDAAAAGDSLAMGGIRSSIAALGQDWHGMPTLLPEAEELLKRRRRAGSGANGKAPQQSTRGSDA